MKRVILTGWNGFVGRNIKMKLEQGNNGNPAIQII